MRLTEDQFAELMKTSKCRVHGKAKLKRERVQSRKVRLDGHEFDSAKEAEIYLELKRDPAVEILKLQPKFTLLEGFERNGKRLRPITWTADFLIKKNGREIVVEVKSLGTKKANSKSWPMRRKLFLSRYPELVYREIFFNGRKRIEKEY